MAKEKKSWEEDSTCAVAQEEGSAAPPAAAPGPLAEKASESSTLRGSGQHNEDMNELKITTDLDGGQNSWRRSEGTAI
jgi:hypothetical protein